MADPFNSKANTALIDDTLARSVPIYKRVGTLRTIDGRDPTHRPTSLVLFRGSSIGGRMVGLVPADPLPFLVSTSYRD